MAVGDERCQNFSVVQSPMHIRNHDLGECGVEIEDKERMPREYLGDIILLKS